MLAGRPRCCCLPALKSCCQSSFEGKLLHGRLLKALCRLQQPFLLHTLGLPGDEGRPRAAAHHHAQRAGLGGDHLQEGTGRAGRHSGQAWGAFSGWPQQPEGSAHSTQTADCQPIPTSPDLLPTHPPHPPTHLAAQHARHAFQRRRVCPHQLARPVGQVDVQSMVVQQRRRVCILQLAARPLRRRLKPHLQQRQRTVNIRDWRSCMLYAAVQGRSSGNKQAAASTNTDSSKQQPTTAAPLLGNATLAATCPPPGRR